MKSKVLFLGLLMFFVIGAPVSNAQEMADSPLAKIEALIGAQGKFNEKENVVKVSFPRNDIQVEAHGVKLTPPMGLTVWAAFKLLGDHAMVMGDMVLLENQVNPVMDVALQNGLEVTALHNHFFGDTPKIMFMHIGGTGDVETLATAVGKVFTKIKENSGEFPEAKINPAESTLDPEKINNILGAQGEMKDGVYKVTFGRTTSMGGHEMGNAMGVNTWAAFAGSDEQAIVDGDFAMLESEVQGVLKALRSNGINIVAIHNHMTMESPRIIFLHYWGLGSTSNLAKALKAALDTQEVEENQPGKIHITFDNASLELPPGWKADATGPKGLLAQWQVIADVQAPSAPNVLSIIKINDKYSGVFNLFWNPDVRFKNGIVEAKIRANTGEEDRGGGLIWRAKDVNNYYIARYNPLEGNFRLYYVKDGTRKMLGESEKIEIKTGEWFVLTVHHKGNKITCRLNGRELLHAEDSTFAEAGGVGFWTKADAASSFDDLHVETQE